MDQCVTQTPILIDIKAVNSSIANTVYFSMKLNVQEEVNGAPPEMILVVEQCDLKKKRCEHYQNISINELFEKLKDPNSLYSKLIAEIKPSYSIMDLSRLTGLPIDGPIYVADIKWKSEDTTILCLEN